ncbi:hypothetical protein BYT27DRAFT_7261855 [Phlegmacium glaucopus]|nr:hypothetical protein BYT27DRAFT_7261855 [Phlegmacium glaucopus]
MSLTMDALVTGLIAFRVAKVYWNVKNTLYKNTLGATGGSKIRSIIFIIIESGMALLACQIVWVVCALVLTPAATKAVGMIMGPHQMGIAPTIIQVRVAMGLSFYDENSMISMVELEVAGGFHGVSDYNSNSISEVGGSALQEATTDFFTVMAANQNALAISSGDIVDLVSSSGSVTIHPSDDAILTVLQARFRADLPYTSVRCTNLLDY